MDSQAPGSRVDLLNGPLSMANNYSVEIKLTSVGAEQGLDEADGMRTE